MLFTLVIQQESHCVYVARQPETFIPQDCLAIVYNYITVTKRSIAEATDHLRSLLGPNTFRPLTPESHLDKLRTIVATYHYKHTLAKFSEDGIDFIHHIFVPEADDVTGEIFHERADHGHLLKRIAGKCM